MLVILCVTLALFAAAIVASAKVTQVVARRLGLDLMTILLVFLIQSYATEPENININLGLRPPESSATDMMEPAARVI